MWVYIRSEPGLFTVGFYDPTGRWHPDSDYNNREEAAKRVSFLNGNGNIEQIVNERDGWISVEDGDLPTKNEDVLIFKKETNYSTVGFYSDNGWSLQNGKPLFGVSYWKHISPPKEKK